MEDDIELFKDGLRFDENGGEVEFTYREECRDSGHYRISEVVPEKIVKKGEKSILNYALRKVAEAKKEWKKWELVKDDIRKNNIPFKTKYADGTNLEGRIVEATSRIIRVELDKPLRGESSIHFGYASAMSGQYVFTKDKKISRHGYDAARRALCGAYEDALHKPQKDLVSRLNKSVDSD